MLARRWKVVSWFGKIADSLADKTICLTVLWLLAMYYNSGLLLFVAVLFSVYDITTMTLRFTTTHRAKPVAAAHLVAKAKTLILMAGLCLLVLDLIMDTNTAPFIAGICLLVISCGLAVWSLQQYLGQILHKQENRA